MKSILDLKIYKIYDVHKSSFIKVCNTLNDLLFFLSRYQRNDWLSHYIPGREKEFGYSNTYLDNVNMNFNDTMKQIDNYYESSYNFRKYVFLDPYNRIIDVRQYINEIVKLASTKTQYYSYECKLGFKPVKFRQEPMPGIHKSHHHRGSYYRHPKTMNEKRQTSIVEYKDYIRPARRVINLPDIWDDKVRHFDKSWKSQSKKKKQWM